MIWITLAKCNCLNLASFEVKGNNLIITDKSEEGKTLIFDIRNFTSNAKT